MHPGMAEKDTRKASIDLAEHSLKMVLLGRA